YAPDSFSAEAQNAKMSGGQAGAFVFQFSLDDKYPKQSFIVIKSVVQRIHMTNFHCDRWEDFQSAGSPTERLWRTASDLLYKIIRSAQKCNISFAPAKCNITYLA